jgi:nucleoside-diphosphate-sugar epimerase
LVNIVASVAKKNISINHVPGPIGVRGRNSNNDLIRDKLEWDYQLTLKEGIEKTYHWIASQIAESI